MKNLLYFLTIVLCLTSCGSKSDQQSSDDPQTVSTVDRMMRKIDIHAHYRYPRTYMDSLHEQWNMQWMLVDVAKEDSVGTTRSWDRYVAHTQAHPDLFFLCSSLVGVGIDAPDFAQREITRLGQEIDAGAKMMKVWKNFGMVTKDASGTFIQIDDARLQPIWDFLKDRGIPVIAHIGEPMQAWRPIDPNNPHAEYYKNNPQYHAYNHPEIPSYETIIAARDRWIENNPGLKILCAHLGSMSHDVDMVAERLDRFPNMRVEPAARFGDLARQDSEKVRAFFEKYQDRIMFGSDYGNYTSEDTMTDAALREEEKELNTSYNSLWSYLSSTDSLVIRKQKTVGLGLPTDILHKFYFQNAADFLQLE